MTLVACICVAALAAKSFLVSRSSARIIRSQDGVRTTGLSSGEEFVEEFARAYDLGAVTIAEADVDGYIASKQTLQLARGRRKSHTIGAVGIAAHESAHMLQHASGYKAWQVWWVLSLPALICAWSATGLTALALILHVDLLATVALGLLLIPVGVGVVSVFVERDAVRRAKDAIARQGITGSTAGSLERVVRAAARVYVVETVFDIGFLLRRLGVRRPPDGPRSGRRRRRGPDGVRAAGISSVAAGYGLGSGGFDSSGGSGSGGGTGGGGGGAW